MYSIPTSELKEIVGGENGNDSKLPQASRNRDLVGSRERGPDAGKIVSCRLSFPELLVEKGKEKAFVQELSDQLRVALSGIGAESLPATCIGRKSDEEPVMVQVSIPLFRGEQLKSLLAAPGLLTYTPLLKFAKFDNQYWIHSSGAAKAYEEAGLSFPAPDVLARLDEMEKRYMDIKERKNIVESFHEIMKRTNPYEQKMEALRRIENPPNPFPGEDLPEQPAPVPSFPWSGVSGVLSPRAKAPPPPPEGFQYIIDPSNSKTEPQPVVRAQPPSATAVLAKNALEMALQQLSIDGVQLNAASSEIARRLDEAEEHSELRRIAAAGLASPQVLEQLVVQSTLKREQARQRDELTVLKAWEKDAVASAERENNMLYMQKLYALATGDEAAAAQLENGEHVILNPEQVRKRREQIAEQSIKAMMPTSSNRREKIGLYIDVIRGSNLPINTECFVRFRVAEMETQTSTISDGGNWNERLLIEWTIPGRGSLDILLYQYNSVGRDVLLGKTAIPLSQVRDTDGQSGVWVLGGEAAGIAPMSLSLKFTLEDPTAVSAYKGGLQATQNIMRERNMDFIQDQVERVEEERRRLNNRIDDLSGQSASLGFFPGQPPVPGQAGSEEAIPGPFGASGSGQSGVSPVALVSGGGLREVERPSPSYDSVFSELVELIKRGQLSSPEGRQLAYDFSYLGQSKRDFGKDKKLLDYLSVQSDVLAQFNGDFPIQIAGLCSVCVMLMAVGEDPAKRRQISLVVWEAANRNLSLASQDSLLAEQVLTALALISQPPRTGSELVEFALNMFTRAKEPIQLEQILQVLLYCKSSYRQADQIKLSLTVLERYRFNPKTVERALTVLSMLHSLPATTIPSPATGDVELVVVAAGMYADNASIQVAAIEALSAMAGASAQYCDQIENLVSPVVLDQSLDRNQNHNGVQLGVARLLLKLADYRPKNFNVPEAIPVLLKIIGASSLPGNVEAVLVSLAAIRACHTSAKSRDAQLYNISDPVAGQFVSSIEQQLVSDASIAREACLTIEAIISNPDVREALIKAGIVAVPLKSLQAHSTEYPKMVKQFLSALHSLVLLSPRAAYQLARLDGVQVLMNLGLYASSEWRTLAILSDACCVAETKSQFQPNDDIERLVALIEKSASDTEVILQSVRLIGEIAFNSKFSMKDLFRRVHEPINVELGGAGQVNFPLQPTLWAILNKRIPQKNQDKLERLTTPNGRDLVLPVSDSIIRDYNLWVTSQGGAEAGASIANRKGNKPGRSGTEVRQEGGLFDTITGFFGTGGGTDELGE